MARRTPQQVRNRARLEALIGVAAPALDLFLAAGDRVSKIAARAELTSPTPHPRTRLSSPETVVVSPREPPT